ncbi:hypothetical protein GCM10009787_28010 [Streptomyces bangladeshensis]|uniref:Uncharacterized protein n=1 Tax=Streptomyces bangladeshensis TaxID=295352 RepID=A0ABN3BHX6_9ACTN
MPGDLPGTDRRRALCSSLRGSAVRLCVLWSRGLAQLQSAGVEIFWQLSDAPFEGLDAHHGNAKGVDHVDAPVRAAQVEGGVPVLRHGAEMTDTFRFPCAAPRAHRQPGHRIQHFEAVDGSAEGTGEGAVPAQAGGGDGRWRLWR